MEGVLAKLRANQLALYAVAGAIGGALGSVLAELVDQVDPGYYNSRAEISFWTGLWSAVFTSVLAATLFVAVEWYQRREIKPPRAANVLLFGALAGFIAGGLAQTLYSADVGSSWFHDYVIRTLCWGLLGALVGGFLTRPIPNLSLQRGLAAGFIGGAVGGIFFLQVSSVLPEVLGRVVGIAALGLALGLAMYAAENLFREASIEIIWAPNETSRVGLGGQPVSIGGGEDHIFVRGLPPHVSTIEFNNGHIEHVETANGKRTPLQDGSRLRIGSVYLVVHAAK
jgi:uncharacterized membrane protein YeaQ/YmgE (transglycosylase-associated protein family)